MSKQHVYEQLKSYVVEHLLAGDDDGLDADTQLLETRVIDSMSMIDVIAFIERSFNVQIPHVDVSPIHFQTLETITALVVRLVHERGADGRP